MSLGSEGLPNKEIGRRLNISDGTIVHYHTYQKREISNQTVLASTAHIAQNTIERFAIRSCERSWQRPAGAFIFYSLRTD
jgi:hypothetical protein